MSVAMSDPDDDRIAAEFLVQYLADRYEGREMGLAAYLGRYPGHEAVVAREWAAMQGGVDPTPAPRESFMLGPYRIVREIGRGGQGVVYLARDTRLARDVALKVLARGASSADGDALRRFQREAEVAARLDHPGICAVHDAGADRGTLYIAMRHVDGAPLGVLLREARAGSPATNSVAAALGRRDAASIGVVLALVEAIARALHAAHLAGVVHRDVKPGNVMITPSGDPVVLDFGMARLHDGDDGAAPMTRTGDVLGTPAYMAPEQISGETRTIDRRADVWALGVLAFECLTLSRPFEAPADAALADAIRSAPLPDPRSRNPGISPDLAVVLATALERDLSRRYATALDLAEELLRARVHEPILARPAGPIVRLRSFVRRNPVVAALVALAFILLLAGLAVAVSLLAAVRDEASAKSAALASVLRLSDAARMRALADRESGLWPLRAAIVPACDAWLAEAASVFEARGEHERALVELRSRATPRDAAATRPIAERLSALRAVADASVRPREGMMPRWLDRIDARREHAALLARDGFVWPDDASAWIAEVLSGLVASYPDLEAIVREVQERRDRAVSLARRTIDACSAKWREAAADVAALPAYHGLVLAPQEGLVPLRRDPASSLWEFWHVESGDRPVFDDDLDAWRVDPHTGIVLVLLPPGVATIGASLGGRNADLDAQRNEVPEVEVPLDAFFLARFEVTQGQWMRLSGGPNPAVWRAERQSTASDAHPVESVSYDAGLSVLRRAGLTLPTEAQWEYGCRAGTSSPWSCGSRARELAGFANVADRSSRFSPNEREIDDGWHHHAPVGSFRPNAFGLHDMHGNVWEWCRDVYEATYASPPIALDGLRSPPDDGMRVVRGGAFNRLAAQARCAIRVQAERSTAEHDIGLRAARAVDR